MRRGEGRGSGDHERRALGGSGHPFSRLNHWSHGKLGPLQSRCHRRRYRHYRLSRVRDTGEVSEEVAAGTVGASSHHVGYTEASEGLYP